MATNSAQGKLDPQIVAEWHATVRGRLMTPEHPEYDTARRVWNGAIDCFPALILQCADAADVVAGVRFARTYDLPLAIRGGGHNVAGFGTCDGGLVLDLGALNNVWVEPQAGGAVVGGGATWGAVDHATQAFGLATTGGLVSTTGIAGLTLGGGVGWLMRLHGLACDNLRAVDLVTAAGELRRVNRDTDPALFWALRGGGGNFGVVTTFEYQLHPVGPLVYAGPIFYPFEAAVTVLDGYLRWAPTLPPTVSTLLAFLTAPPMPPIPEAVQGKPVVAVIVCHVGNIAEGERLAQPLRRDFAPPAADLLGPLPYTVLQTLFDPAAPRGLRNYWKGAYIDTLPPAGQAALIRQAEAMVARSPLSQIHLQQMGGAVSEVPLDATAFAGRAAAYVANIIGTWTTAEEDDVQKTWVRETWAALRPYARAETYLNFASEAGAEDVLATFGKERYRRLAEVKARLDPNNLFRLNHNIVP